MTVTYSYENLGGIPLMDYIHETVETSEMTNKSLASCDFYEGNMKLRTHWETALDASDKTLLDGIVADSVGKTINPLPKGEFVFQVDVPDRWTECRGYVSFGREVNLPSEIKLSHIFYEGFAGLKVETITEQGFTFWVLSTERWLMKINSVVFKWEAIA